MANTNTDLTEEDAADLQFPKVSDYYVSSPPMLSEFSSCSSSEYNDTTSCVNCCNEVSNRYVLCEQCNVNICLNCFSNGAEFLYHKNDHDYRILTTNFVLFENSDWTAEEELKLLDSIVSYGNWNLVAQDLPNKTVAEIIEHYDYFYLQRKGSNSLPKIKERAAAVFPELIVPYRFRLSDSDDPPRFLSNTVGYKSLAGYNPARSDFENEYDKNAEDILSNLEVIEEDDPHYELLTKLQCALVTSYNRRLKERQRWKNIIRNHGLLLVRKTLSWLHRYDLTVQKPVYEKLIRFMQYCEPVKFEMLMEGLHRVGELRIHISRLIHLRKKGIKTMAEGRLYLKLQQIHDENRKSLKLFRSIPQYNWKHSREANPVVCPRFNQRRTFAPLDVTGMPGYTKLSSKEIELCSTVRLVPAAYLQLREILVSEYKKQGTLKLQTARRLLKIDVNKTRKLYDFLIDEGYIANS